MWSRCIWQAGKKILWVYALTHTALKYSSCVSAHIKTCSFPRGGQGWGDRKPCAARPTRGERLRRTFASWQEKRENQALCCHHFSFLLILCHPDTNPLMTQLLRGHPCQITAPSGPGIGFPGTASVSWGGDKPCVGFPSEGGAVGKLTCPRLSKLYL